MVNCKERILKQKPQHTRKIKYRIKHFKCKFTKLVLCIENQILILLHWIVAEPYKPEIIGQHHTNGCIIEWSK